MIEEHSTNVTNCIISCLQHIVHVFHSTPEWEERCLNKGERSAYPFPQCSHLYLGRFLCKCFTCSFNPFLRKNVHRHCVHAKVLPSWTAEMWCCNVDFHLNTAGHNSQLCKIPVCFLPETRPVALAVNWPLLCAAVNTSAGQPVTTGTWQRHKKLWSVYEGSCREHSFMQDKDLPVQICSTISSWTRASPSRKHASTGGTMTDWPSNGPTFLFWPGFWLTQYMVQLFCHK